MRAPGGMPRSISAVVAALRGFAERWTTGRRWLASAGLIALIAAAATSALVASAVEPPKHDAVTPPRRPSYLLPVGTLVRDGVVPAPALTGDRGGVGVPVRAPKAPTVAQPGVAARQGPSIAMYQGAAGTLTPAGIATLALESGCGTDTAPLATAIAMAESGGSPGAQGDIGLMTSVWDWSAGLWQIRGLRAERHTGALRDSIANQAVGHNAAAMHVISQGCTDWTPWSTFNNGAYQQFMTLAQQAVGYLVAYYAAHHHYPPVPPPDPDATIPSQGAGGAAADQPGGRAIQATPSPQRTQPTRQSDAAPPPAASTGGTQTAAPVATANPPAPSSSPNQPAPLSPLPTAVPTTTTSLPVPLPSTTLPLPLPLPSTPHLP